MLAFAFATSANAQGLGVSAGLNFNELGDIEAGDSDATFDNSTGWHVHLWVDLPAGPIAVRPGLRYMDAGSVLKGEGLPDIPDEDQALSLLEIPIDLRYRFAAPIVTPYIMAGPVLRFPTSQDDEERFNSFSFAAGVGIGAEIGFGGLQLFPELKYTFGITGVTEDEYTIGGVTFEPENDQRLNAVMLSLGFGL